VFCFEVLDISPNYDLTFEEGVDSFRRLLCRYECFLACLGVSLSIDIIGVNYPLTELLTRDDKSALLGNNFLVAKCDYSCC